MYTRAMDMKRVMANNDVMVPHNAIEYPDSYGIEVELEGRRICKYPAPVAAYWVTHHDGSLRQIKDASECIEYVSRCPFDIKDTEKAINLLFKFLSTPPVEVFDSYRTSIHVHVNFAMEEARTIYNFICLSLILDELLTSQNGDHRVGNNFCLRAKDAMGQVVGLVDSIEQTGTFLNVPLNDRYSSINFASLRKFGSIEFRSLECTLHEGRVMHWIRTLARIKEVSKKFLNPIEVIQKFSAQSPTQFLEYVLGPFSLKYKNVEGAEKMLHQGMRIAQDFAYCSLWREVAAGERPEPTPLRSKFLHNWGPGEEP